jgi:hypothetical protein
MEHPFISDLSKLSMDDLQEKISELNKRLAFVARMNNTSMYGQLLMVIDSYNNEYNKRMNEMYKKYNLNNTIQITNKKNDSKNPT